MKKSTKAALLSGLLFPGLGHLYLRKWWSGAILVVIAGMAITVIAANAIEIASSIAREIELGAVPADPEAITELIAQRSRSAAQSTNRFGIIFVVTWVFAILHSYRLGRARDLAEHEAGRQDT